MVNREKIGPLRRTYRNVLYSIMICSFLFFCIVVFLRFHPGLMSHKEVRDITFHFDVIQNQAFMAFTDDFSDLQIIKRMILNSVFSDIYAHAGVKQLKKLADSGYSPAQIFYADLILSHAETYEDIELATLYYQKAITKNNPMAKFRLEQLSQLRPMSVAEE